MDEIVTQARQQSVNRAAILVVDDEPGILNALAEILALEEFKVLCASDGSQALCILENERIDLVLSDLMMPNINGIELLNQIRKHPKFFCVPVILMSASPNRPETSWTYSAFLKKPIDLEVLIATISGSL